MVVSADNSAASRRQFARYLIKPLQRFSKLLLVVEIRSNEIPVPVENIQEAAVPERLIPDAHVRSFIQINRNAHALQCRIGLRTPGASGLTVTTGSRGKNPPQIRHPR